MIYIFYFFAVILVYFSCRSFLSGLEYLNYFRRELAGTSSGHQPFATIIAPCKGLDEGIRENFAALFEQNYPAYEVIFVTDDENDPTVPVIKDLLDQHKNTKLIIAAKASNTGQKVENLREAVLHADNASEVFVFVDSDARPAKDWLRCLAASLADGNIGAATGYRWFFSKRSSLATELLSVWNASIASALGPNEKTNFCWGGSTAIRRDVFEKIDMRNRWKGTLSDDFAVTRAVRSAGLGVKFVPQALTPTVEDVTFRQLFEFTTRQMKITRVYMPGLWIKSLIGAAVYCGVVLAALGIIIFSRQKTFTVWFSIATLTLVATLSTAKAYLRLKAVTLAMNGCEELLRKQTFSQLALWAVTPFIYLVNCLMAAFSRTIRWRGTNYEIVSPTETNILSHLKK
ncbi:MAG: glycosyltransferase [Acidobacteria bacterium]|nr:glycosyltransferase [Acidobacteriota bacterium]